LQDDVQVEVLWVIEVEVGELLWEVGKGLRVGGLKAYVVWQNELVQPESSN